MNTLARSTITAVVIAAAVQFLMVGLLSKKLPREVCRPGVSTVKELNFNDVSNLRLLHSDGPIEIKTHALDGVNVRARVRIYFDAQETRALAEEYLTGMLEAEVGHDGTLLLVTEPEPRPDTMDIRVNYVLEVPKGTGVEIDGDTGNIYIAEGCGDVSVIVKNADIDIYAPLGDVNARSINGRIRVFETAGDTRLTTVNGSIYARLLGGSLHADTTNGSIVGFLPDAEVKECNLTSVNGGITLSMPEAASAFVQANADMGVIQSDFPVSGRLAPVVVRREMEGTIGRGHTRLMMASMNGNISITRSGT